MLGADGLAEGLATGEGEHATKSSLFLGGKTVVVVIKEEEISHSLPVLEDVLFLLLPLGPQGVDGVVGHLLVIRVDDHAQEDTDLSLDLRISRNSERN